MSHPKELGSLSEIAADYDAILSDVWGVIHNGRAAFVAACAALRAFRQERGPVVLITNAPVPKVRVTAVFDRVGVPHDCYDDVVSSGDATRSVLAQHAPGPVYAIGLREDELLYEGLGVRLTGDPADAKIVCCTSLREYPNGHPEAYREELRELAGRGLAMICANPDVQFRHGDRLIWSAGSLARIYEQFGGAVIRPGKPDAPIYDVALRRLGELSGKAHEPRRILAIGDGPSTDLRGAEVQGLDSIFIGEGVHGHALVETAGESFIDSVRNLLTQEGVKATYAMPLLR